MIHVIRDGKQVPYNAWLIPDGVYRAVWTGHRVAFEVDGKLCRAKEGRFGMNALICICLFFGVCTAAGCLMARFDAAEYPYDDEL